MVSRNPNFKSRQENSNKEKDEEMVKCEKCGVLVFRHNLNKRGLCSKCLDDYETKKS